MEVNARIGSSVALPVRAGVDFPSLLHAWATGGELREITSYRVGERLRWLVGDMWFLNTAFARQPGPDVPTPRAVKTVLRDFVARPSRFDRSSVTDRYRRWPKWATPSACTLCQESDEPFPSEEESDKARPVRVDGRRRHHRRRGLRPVDCGPLAATGRGTPDLRCADASVAKHVRRYASEVRRLRDVDSTPENFLSLPEYCRAHGEEDYEPIPIASFAKYGTTVQQQVVPYLEPVDVVGLRRERGVFELTLATGERATARQVVVAIGLTYFERVPAPFDKLPAELVCHTANRGDFTGFEGWDVTVVGAGQSALQAAALLHEHGAETRMLARGDIKWGGHGKPDSERSLIERIKAPMTVLGHGRDNWKLEHLPGGSTCGPTRSASSISTRDWARWRLVAS